MVTPDYESGIRSFLDNKIGGVNGTILRRSVHLVLDLKDSYQPTRYDQVMGDQVTRGDVIVSHRFVWDPAGQERYYLRTFLVPE